MVKSDAANVDQYLNELSNDRKIIVQQVREEILKNLNPGFVEVVNWGMISSEIPLETYPDTYNHQPLQYAALASQKQYVSVYLMNIYQDAGLNQYLLDGFKKNGQKTRRG